MKHETRHTAGICALEHLAFIAEDLKMFRIGINFGGTKIEAVVFDAQDRKLFHRCVETQPELR
jgi:hypothetical protein